MNTSLINPPVSMGSLLVATGRLKDADLPRIEAKQAASGLPFGEAAIALGLLSKVDVDFALSRQFNYTYLQQHDASLAHELVAAYRPFSPVGEHFRVLRSQLLLRWFKPEAGHTTLAVVSPQPGDGRSFVAANLAVVFAQQGQRTLLVDANLRQPQLDQWFKPAALVDKSAGLAAALAGRAPNESWQYVKALPGLSVLPAGNPPPNPQELLTSPALDRLLMQARRTFDVVVIDTPASTQVADGELVAARAGAALLVARRHRSGIGPFEALARRLREAGVKLAGSVLNDN